MNEIISLFDFDRIKRNRAFAVENLRNSDFLIQKSIARIIDNIKDIHRDFETIAVIGSRGADEIKDYFANKTVTVFDVIDAADQVMKVEIPDLTKEHYDCIVALPYLHTVNDVTGFLKTVKAALKPDGLFLCSLFGGQTLHELRQSIMQVELETCGGAAQHIHPMIDHYQFAGLLQSAGFGLPVVDYDRVTVGYSKLETLYADIKNMGEGSALSQQPQSLSSIQKQIESYYKTHFYDDGFIASFDILHGIGWAPHESQQQPARRGSGEVSLADIL